MQNDEKVKFCKKICTEFYSVYENDAYFDLFICSKGEKPRKIIKAPHHRITHPPRYIRCGSLGPGPWAHGPGFKGQSAQRAHRPMAQGQSAQRAPWDPQGRPPWDPKGPPLGSQGTP